MKLYTKVYGVKRSKGMIDGRSFDSTVVFVEVPMQESEDMKGLSVQPMKFGTSENFKQFVDAVFPFEAEVDLDTVTNGKTITQQVNSVRPIKPVKPEAK